MFSSATLSLRTKLRSVIGNSFPNLTAEEIFAQIKKPENAYVLFEDLYPYCDAANISYDKLPIIFSPYKIRDDLISSEKFTDFYNDEFLTAAPPIPISDNLSPESVLILKSFASAIKARTDPHPSVRWSTIICKNPPLTEPSKIRLATLCRLCDDYNLPFKVSHFIDAIYEFFGKKFDALNFEEFSRLMATFG